MVKFSISTIIASEAWQSVLSPPLAPSVVEGWFDRLTTNGLNYKTLLRNKSQCSFSYGNIESDMEVSMVRATTEIPTMLSAPTTAQVMLSILFTPPRFLFLNLLYLPEVT